MTARRKPKPELRPRFSYAVRWRRRFHDHPQVKFFERRAYAERYAGRLRRGTMPNLDPLVELVVQRRRVEPWEDITEEVH